jgi:hypothetical protein
VATTIITGYVHVTDVSQAGTYVFLATASGFVVLTAYRSDGYTLVFSGVRASRTRGLPGPGSADPLIRCATVPLAIDPPSQSAPMRRSQDGGSETSKAHPLNLLTLSLTRHQASRGKTPPTSARTQRVFVPP